jgi:ergothioneine biosynthesis protein EgtB
MSPRYQPAHAARTADDAALREALLDARTQTLAAFAACAAALPALQVPYRSEVNPPLWELGHVGWFQEWWIARNPLRALGAGADPAVARTPSRLAGADRLYDSSAVPHDTRWSLELPGSQATLDFLADGIERTLALLARAGPQDQDLYFYRLCLFHEDMHNEAAIYMANSLGFGIAPLAPAGTVASHALRIPAAHVGLGWQGAGFAFDNELPGPTVALGAYEIDAAPVSNARYAAFVEAGGYEDRRFWSEAGWAWRASHDARAPRFWRASGATWQQRRFGQWQDLGPHQVATNLACHEAEAWCAWAGRRLPREAEWEHAALTQAEFCWGDAWEWSADRFAPYPGFAAHPYRDYSAPWFDSRRVLRGGSIATHARMRHPRYRNFFTPERNDIFAGFRTCAM